MNTETTTQKIIEAAEVMENAAQKLRRQADELNRTEDFTIAGECITTITNMFNNMRLDLFVIRPIREHQRAIADTQRN